MQPTSNKVINELSKILDATPRKITDMTPKEKAKELLGKMKYHYDEQVNPYFVAFTDDDLAKRCALIAVDEIIENLQDYNGLERTYWEEVKQEIQAI
jgi:hypothetical protein